VGSRPGRADDAAAVSPAGAAAARRCADDAGGNGVRDGGISGGRDRGGEAGARREGVDSVSGLTAGRCNFPANRKQYAKENAHGKSRRTARSHPCGGVPHCPFIPSVDREETVIEQEGWVTASLKMLGTYFRGGTAFPQGRGVWRDDARGGRLVFDEPTVVQCYTKEALVDEHLEVLRDFLFLDSLFLMGRATNQGAVGIVIDREYYEITVGDLP
jgi:hypothetical protein